MTVCHDNSQALFLSPRHTKEGKKQVGSILARHHSMSYRIITPLFYLIFKNFVLHWSIVDKQCCVSFRCTAKWFSYTYTCIYSFSNSFPILKSLCGLKFLLEISLQVPKGLPIKIVRSSGYHLTWSEVVEKFLGKGREKLGESRFPGNLQTEWSVFLSCSRANTLTTG